MSRKAEDILHEQNKKIEANFHSLKELYLEAENLKNTMVEGKFNSVNLGEALENNWKLKRKFAAGIANEQIDSLYRECLASGATGGKLLGAGGGGFILANVPTANREDFLNKMKKYLSIPVSIEHRGTRVLSRVHL